MANNIFGAEDFERQSLLCQTPKGAAGLDSSCVLFEEASWEPLGLRARGQGRTKRQFLMGFQAEDNPDPEMLCSKNPHPPATSTVTAGTPPHLGETAAEAAS